MSSNPMRLRLKKKGEVVEVKVLIEHPMHTGRQRNKSSGKLIPAHYINQVTAKINNKEASTIRCGGGVSKNPYFGFRLNGAKTNDKVTVSWTDNLGKSGAAEATVK
jgi:sulfur-oxidizing protein SoxZ